LKPARPETGTMLEPSDRLGTAPPWESRATLAVALAFGILSSLSRPFFSNQHTYLARAARRSGSFEELASDWFANTTDPTPVFSTVAALLIRAAGPFALVAANALAGACFLYGLTVSAERIRASGVARTPRPVIAALLAVVWFSLPRMRAVVFEGVAEQYVHREFFQPASFGVLLIVAFAAFSAGWFTRGILLAAAAVWFHPTYAFSFALLTLAVLVASPESIERRAVWAGVAAASILPPLIVAWIQFMPASMEQLALAQAILVESRLPHHAIPERWFDGAVVMRLLLVAATVLTCRRAAYTQLWIVAGAVVVLAFLAHLFPEARSLRLLFPWRVSSWLTPIAFAVLLHACVSPLYLRSPRYVTLATVVLAGWAAVRGAMDGLERLEKPASPGLALARTLRNRLPPGPIRTVLIPPEWEDVRLNAKLPVFVDFKSHPYRDMEVLGWWERVVAARAFYAGSPAERCSRLNDILKLDASIGWILSPPAKTVTCPRTRILLPTPAGSIHEVVRD
jgi:hypothetical protein